MQRKVTFTESNRDQKIVQGILEYKKKQGLTTFIDAVRNICEIGLDYKLTVFPSGKKCSLSSAIQATSRKLLHLFNVSWILQNFICGFPLNSSYFVSE